MQVLLYSTDTKLLPGKQHGQQHTLAPSLGDTVGHCLTLLRVLVYELNRLLCALLHVKGAHQAGWAFARFDLAKTHPRFPVLGLLQCKCTANTVLTDAWR